VGYRSTSAGRQPQPQRSSCTGRPVSVTVQEIQPLRFGPTSHLSCVRRLQNGLEKHLRSSNVEDPRAGGEEDARLLQRLDEDELDLLLSEFRACWKYGEAWLCPDVRSDGIASGT
jgi:hypothetical protein